jgi:uncharacterized alpha-E superfamily protein
MISRVAESCFWLNRYVERAENTSRLLSVNRAFELDVDLPARERWWPIVVVGGEQDRIRSHLSGDALYDGEQVQEYLTWEQDNPTSIASSVYWARENARTIREVISLEMWETLNAFWHWMRGGAGRRLYREDRDSFYKYVRERSVLFQGSSHSTMLHEEPFDFMRLGMLLERAGWTARILDVKHHIVGLAADGPESPLETAQAMALLRSCSATDSFFKRVHSAPTGRRVVAFLLEAETLPRSVLHCLDRAWNFLRRVQPASGVTGQRSARMLSALLEDLRSLSTEDIFARGLHEELTRIIDSVAEICQAVHDDYFALQVPPPALASAQQQA